MVLEQKELLPELVDFTTAFKIQKLIYRDKTDLPNHVRFGTHLSKSEEHLFHLILFG